MCQVEVEEVDEMRDLTQVAFKPYQKITIRSKMRYPSAQAFADALTLSLARGMGGRGGNLFWANGILFRHFPFAPSDTILKEYLDGHLPIDHIDYAPMPEYSAEIRSGEIVVTVLNVTYHTILSRIGRWLATESEEEQTENQSARSRRGGSARRASS